MTALQWIAIVFGGILGCILLGILGFLLFRAMRISQLRSRHHITAEKGIDEELTLEVGGIPQHVYIRGQNQENPVILFLHGGPGGAMIPMLHTYQYLWEQDYTVVNWDQRVCGKTYFLNKSNIEPLMDLLTAEKILEDLEEIVHYLQKRFHKEKIILVGHSWGTILGSQFSLSHPHLIEAYVGIAQAVNLQDGILKWGESLRNLLAEQSAASELAALEALMEQVRSSKAIPEREVLALCKLAKQFMPVNMDSTIFFRNGLFSPYYSLKQLMCYAKMEELTKPLHPYLQEFDLRRIGSRYAVPVILISGEYDWHMNLLAKEYFETVTAPYKEFISIPESGHVVMMDEPELFFQAFTQGLESSRRKLHSGSLSWMQEE